MAMTWKAAAAAAEEAGYLAGNDLEKSLERHLRRLFPDLVTELGADLTPYLEVQVHLAHERMYRMEDQGMDPQAAREMALADLYPTPPDEQDQPEPWEVDDAQAATNDAALRTLTPPPPKTPDSSPHP